MTEIENKPQDDLIQFDMHSIFNKKPEKDMQAANEPSKKEHLKKEESPKAEPIKKEKQETVQELDEEEEPKPITIDYKSELEKLQKTVKDTQRSFHEDRKKLAAYKKAVEKMKEEGTLLDEEATTLLDHTQYESEPEEEPIFVRYGKIWDKEIEYMKKYAPNPKEINQHILAFQHFMQAASPSEIQDALSDLSQYEEDEVEFTRQMLEIGRQYNEDIYGDIHDAGSIRKLKSKYSQKEAELQKKVDKLEKQLNKYKEKYEDYDPTPANLKLPTGSGLDSAPPASFDLATIFNKPYQK